MAYVREATRFKSTEADVDNPTRDQQVIQGAINGAPAVHLPQVVAQMVYQSIINSSVLFEVCIVRDRTAVQETLVTEALVHSSILTITRAELVFGSRCTVFCIWGSEVITILRRTFGCANAPQDNPIVRL